MPRARRCSATRWITVLLPAPSTPSNASTRGCVTSVALAWVATADGLASFRGRCETRREAPATVNDTAAPPEAVLANRTMSDLGSPTDAAQAPLPWRGRPAPAPITDATRLGSAPRPRSARVPVGPRGLVRTWYWPDMLMSFAPRRVWPAIATAALVTVGATASLGGCDRSPAEKTEPDQVEAPKVATPQVTEESCEAYAQALCEVAGTESGTCQSFKSLQDVLAPAACAAGLGNMEHSKAAIEKLGATCKELVAKLCSDLGDDTKTCGLVREQTPNFPPDRCQEMLAQYDTVLDDLKAMEAKNKPLDEAQQKSILAGDPPTFGPADAKVTLVEFSDFQCPYCSKAANVVTQVRDKYGDKVRFVFRQFPLPFHTEAHAASQAALAAHAQGKFWEYHDLLFANQSALKGEDLEKYAKQVGLNVATFNKAMSDKTYGEAVDGDLSMGKSVAVSGTPTVFINGARVSNPTSFETVAAEIDKILGS
ncbi:MAG: hypothetical protein B7733_02090 [Myxococcales bacterium FL481]|nr:MAG: hypothetical protein B7733_02090 [Myxococcales bacterium FL481]